ncbi:MAG: hypothetical protein MJ053_05075 [Elusimicrobiaceae bacterium]|nr:hypothetical protein [Elusimicrobiaceae bacterium]
MSDVITQAVEDTDLSVAPVPAENSETPGHGENFSSADRPADQADTTQDLSNYDNLPLPQHASFTAQDWEDFKHMAADLKLSREQVEKLAAFETSCYERKQEAAAAQKHQQTAAWANETRALYGAGLEQEITFALRAANTFGGPELRALLEETGLGNHPVIIRTLSGIGRTISEDACPGGTPSAPQDKTFAEALYGRRN